MEKPNNIAKITESEPLKKFDLSFIGIGAENVCFETKGSAKKLIKVNIDIIKQKIMDVVNNKDRNHLFKEYQIKTMSERMNQEKMISEFFGADHVLKNGYFHSKIPLDKSLIIQIMGKTFEGFITERIADEEFAIEMIMQTQRIAEELKEPVVYQTEDYSTDLITHNNFRNSKNINKGLHKIEDLINKRFVNSMKEKLEENNYNKIIKEITEKIIAYTKKTGKMLDIFGPNNITLFINKDGKADYHLIDVLLPGSTSNWDINIKDDKNLGLLRHCYTYYYSIKSLADELGIEDNLKPQDLLYFKDSDVPSGAWPTEDYGQQ
jgi:hypothetical protein